ncbi:hypothetical protein [Aureispira anguillae]|uniref:Uncharacterized protein n=1 Tax=Aureispira anguillae TaxID=2864201 RepID=A0A916DR30_9BACT|nr:hypothetical protein [Aureispira anguillae]BDS11559.1 hypothetical protein AsAng_0022730 [Aureispira anguillae]
MNNQASKKLKRTLKVVGFLLVLTLIFRGWIFRQSISYTPIGTRNHIKLTDKKLIATLKLEQEKQTNTSLDEIIKIARNKTNENLSFTTEKSSRNPNQALKVGKANCIAYSALFNSIANYLINAQNLETKYKAIHWIGKIDFMGIDLHQFFESTFFKQHDYNEILNLETGEKIHIDPTISDYLKIHSVSSKINSVENK